MKKKMDEHIRIENDLNEIFSKAEEFNTGAYMIMLYRINNYLSSMSKKIESMNNSISSLEKAITETDCGKKMRENLSNA